MYMYISDDAAVPDAVEDNWVLDVRYTTPRRVRGNHATAVGVSTRLATRAFDAYRSRVARLLARMVPRFVVMSWSGSSMTLAPRAATSFFAVRDQRRSTCRCSDEKGQTSSLRPMYRLWPVLPRLADP